MGHTVEIGNGVHNISPGDIKDFFCSFQSNLKDMLMKKRDFYNFLQTKKEILKQKQQKKRHYTSLTTHLLFF